MYTLIIRCLAGLFDEGRGPAAKPKVAGFVGSLCRSSACLPAFVWAIFDFQQITCCRAVFCSCARYCSAASVPTLLIFASTLLALTSIALGSSEQIAPAQTECSARTVEGSGDHSKLAAVLPARSVDNFKNWTNFSSKLYIAGRFQKYTSLHWLIQPSKGPN